MHHVPPTDFGHGPDGDARLEAAADGVVLGGASDGYLGVYHGRRHPHLQSYRDEFVFRFNRRRTPHAALRTLLGISVSIKPAT